MPEGIAVEVDNGFAVIAPVAQKRNEVLTALLANTPVGLIEKLTRSGPGVQYRVPEGNARLAGLLDDPDGVPVDRADLHFAQELVDSDPNAHDSGHWHHQQITVKGNAYVAGRNGANGAIQGPLRPNKPVADAPGRPAGATLSAAELQARVRANTPNPADYAPQRSTPRPLRAPGGQATIATVVSGDVSGEVPSVGEVASRDVKGYDDGKPDADWSRAALNEYATRLGLDPNSFSNKKAVLDAIREVEPVS